MFTDFLEVPPNQFFETNFAFTYSPHVVQVFEECEREACIELASQDLENIDRNVTYLNLVTFSKQCYHLVEGRKKTNSVKIWGSEISSERKKSRKLTDSST